MDMLFAQHGLSLSPIAIHSVVVWFCWVHHYWTRRHWKKHTERLRLVQDQALRAVKRAWRRKVRQEGSTSASPSQQSTQSCLFVHSWSRTWFWQCEPFRMEWISICCLLGFDYSMSLFSYTCIHTSLHALSFSSCAHRPPANGWLAGWLATQIRTTEYKHQNSCHSWLRESVN